ncbi:MAG TPA: glycosyltransferase [Terriglobales bacterium]|jgi:glycosyltransferase involved in cell wall biosynthesis/peptidoglycan/xylan/chitin deacetylase (PgdA/CDA1 family)
MPLLSQLVGAGLRAPVARQLLDKLTFNRTRGAPIFTLHRVLPDPDACYDSGMAVSSASFARFLDWLAAGYEVVPLTELQARLRQTPRPPRPYCSLTFDDGWADTYQYAFPAWRKRQLPVTVFLATGFIGTRRQFWQERLFYRLQALSAEAGGLERLRAVAAATPWWPPARTPGLDFQSLRRMLKLRTSLEAEAFVVQLCEDGEADAASPRVFMTWEEVATMQQAGTTFGSHTEQHTLLTWAPPLLSQREITHSRQVLQERLGRAPDAFSYPWGGRSCFSRVQVANAGYACAVTTAPGLVDGDADPFLLPRISITEAALPGTAPARLQAGVVRARFRKAPRAAPVPPQPRLRVGFLVDGELGNSGTADSLGGSELQLTHLVRALDTNFFEPEFYRLRGTGDPPAGGLPWPVFAPGATGGRRLALIRSLRALLQRRRPHLVQSTFLDSTLLGVPAAWWAGVPSIVCARRNAGHWRRWHHAFALWWIHHGVSVWQANSPAVAAMLQREEWVPAGAIDLIPNWIDLHRFHPADPAARATARRELGLDQAAFVVVAVANYSPVKALDTLIRAAALAAPRLPRLRVLLLGEGSERPHLQSAIRAEGAGGVVELMGKRERIECYLTAADVGVLPSRSEGCPNAVLEYMAAGLPTVLSDIPPHRALVPEGLFAVGDAAACAAELLQLAAEEPLRRRRGQMNRKRAERYGGEDFAAQIQSHFLRAAAWKPRWRRWGAMSRADF